jgi:hypothetical protein
MGSSRWARLSINNIMIIIITTIIITEFIITIKIKVPNWNKSKKNLEKTKQLNDQEYKKKTKTLRKNFNRKKWVESQLK